MSKDKNIIIRDLGGEYTDRILKLIQRDIENLPHHAKTISGYIRHLVDTSDTNDNLHPNI